MANPFFDQPILNSPQEYPNRHWQLDANGQPTQRIIATRCRAEFIIPISKRKKTKKSQQQEWVCGDRMGLSTKEQQYDLTSIINEVRHQVTVWCESRSSSPWRVAPETARLLQHCRHHDFTGIRPFFCQVDAAETAIWLTKVASKSRCRYSETCRGTSAKTCSKRTLFNCQPQAYVPDSVTCSHPRTPSANG